MSVPEERLRILKMIESGQVSAEDVTGAIRFLLDTPSITGQIIALDGGQHLAWKGRDER